MGETAGSLPQLIGEPSARRGPSDYYRWNAPELRKLAVLWAGRGVGKLPREEVERALRDALKSGEAARRVAGSLSPDERRVLAAYCRYGGQVDGEVIRLDLLARGILEIVDKRPGDTYARRQWKRNIVAELADRWILLPEHAGPVYRSWHGDAPQHPFEHYGVQALLVPMVETAGPPPWSATPAEGSPRATVRRSPAEVALDLSRLFAFVAARGSIKTRLLGDLSVAALRAIEKAVPLDACPDVRVPDPHVLYFGLLRRGGAVRVQGNSGVADPAAADRMFAGSDARQARSWARAWIATREWNDGLGSAQPHGADDESRGVPTARQVVAWALGCLARAGDHWYDLGTFLTELHALQGDVSLHLPYTNLAWDPQLAPPDEDRPGAMRYPRGGPFRREGQWYANILMGTLVELGLVERGRLGQGAEARHAFRLTETGRAVFGAPEVPMPAEAAGRRFLVVQPNFDLLAYMDEADAAPAALLGRVAVGDAPGAGPVRTLRLTRESVYRAEEAGLGHDRIVGLLERHGRGAVPANLLRSLADWTGRRESLVVRSGVTLLGFPTEAARDDYLRRHGGTACGSRFALQSGRQEQWPEELSDALVSGAFGQGRRTLELDEQGTLSTVQPLDIVQRARLGRLASPAGPGWRITGDSIGRAAASGLKPPRVHHWLSDHLTKPMPPLIAHAIDAWMGKAPSLELGDAILLHVPEADLFRAIATSRRLRPFVLDTPGPGWLAVRRETRKELAHALEELGFTIGRQLTWAGGAGLGDET